MLLAGCVQARETNHIVTSTPLSQRTTPPLLHISLLRSRTCLYFTIHPVPIHHTYTFQQAPALCFSPLSSPFATSSLSHSEFYISFSSSHIIVYPLV